MKKSLVLFASIVMMLLCYAQNTWAKCETIINIPTSVCVDVKYDLSINDDPCDCIKYADVEWIITDPGGITTVYTGSPLTYVFTTIGTYKVCVKWTDVCTGESFLECREVVVTDCRCKATVDVPTTLCVGEKYNLAVKDPCDCINYDEVEWIITDPGGTSATFWGSPFSYVFSMPGTYTVCVKWFDHCTGETHYECHDVIVKDCCPTKVDIPTTLCVGEKYNLNVINDCDCIKPTDVVWTITDPGGAVTILPGNPLSFVFSMVGTYKVCVKWFNHCTGETREYCQDVIVKDCCDTKIDIPTTICVGTKYNLNISDAPCNCIDASSVVWTITDPGGTTVSISGNPLSYVFSMVGTYKVCVKWFNHCTGVSKEYCQDVIVKDCCPTSVDIPTTLCVGEKYNLAVVTDCDCINPTDVVWTITDPGGTTTSYTGNPLSYVFSMAGTYKVCVKWFNHCTGETKTYCQDVIVKDCCPTKVDIPTTICAGEKYNLAVVNDCDCIKPTDVVWTITDPGGTTTSYTGNPLSYVFSMVGTYKVCVKWFNHCTGETKTYCQDVIVKDCCETKIDIPTTLCAGEKYNLNISDAPCNCIDATDVVWTITDPGGTTTSYTGNPLSYVFSMVGTYKVCVKWFNHCTGESFEKCQDVIVKDCCETKISIPTTICAGEKYLLSISDDPCNCIKPTDVEWIITDPGGTTTVYTGNPLSYIFSMVGTYTVCVKWFNHCTGETFKKCQDVIVKDCCDTRVDIPTTICAGSKYVLSVTTPPCDCIKPTDVVWTITDPGGTTTSYIGNPLSYIFSTVGVYKVCVKWFNHCTGETKTYCQDVIVKDCCETKVSIPTSICVGTKFNLSVSDAPCDCIKPTDVVWTITDPGGTTTTYTGNPLSYVFSTIGVYKVCVKWFNHCTGESKEYCQDVVVKDCCSCDMKISENTSTTDFSAGVIFGGFHLNSGSKKVIGVDISVPFWNYSWEESGCKFNCDELNNGFPLGNIIKYTDLNGYFPTHAGCFDEWWAREVDWTFPTPQSIDQDFQYVISVPHTDCKIDYYYCVKVLLHYEDCTVCECTFCFKGNEIVCSCNAAGSKPAGKSAKAIGLTEDNVSVYPNPNSGSFTVQMQPTNSTKIISVMDMTGKTVLKSVVSADKANVELKDVASGTYMVVVTTEGKSISKRVVINGTK